MLIPKWRSVTGTVVHVEPTYTVAADSAAMGTVLLSLFMLPFIIGFAFAAWFLSIILSLSGFSVGHRRGFISRVAEKSLGYIVANKVSGPKVQLPVRDFRVRDTLGRDHLVRVRGDLVSGAFSVGDRVEVEGYDHSGTLMLEHGLNKSIGAKIAVKRR